MNWSLLLLATAGLLGIPTVFAGGLYAADYEVEATVAEKECAGPEPPGLDGGKPEAPSQSAQPPSVVGANSTVTITAAFLGIPFDVTVTEFPDDKCWPLRSGDDGNFITVHVRSERAVFYEREGGTCLFDTLYGVGCILPLPDGLATDAVAKAAFALSTAGHTDVVGFSLGGSTNCAQFSAPDASFLQVTTEWPAFAGEELRVRLQSIDEAGSVVGETEVSGASPLTAELALTGVDFLIAVLPDGAVGTTPNVGITLEAAGLDRLSAPEISSCT